MNGLKENCGVVGVYGHANVAQTLYHGLFSLQHRGQESCGIVVSDGSTSHARRDMGLVWEVFSADTLKTLTGPFGIGHVRYSTTGSSSRKNIQPFQIEHQGATLAIAHNGNLVNSFTLRERLENHGSIFQSTIDTEIIMHLLVRSKRKTMRDKLKDALSRLKGAFSLVFLSPEGIAAVKDPWGWRPLCLGKLGDGWMVASESCAFDLAGATYVRELEPGEILWISKDGLHSDFLPRQRVAHCIFEFIYFSRPDSLIFGKSVYRARKRLGERMAKEFPFDADIVVPIPDSGNIAALGFAAEKKLPFEMGIIRNHYVGRTFIQPFQASREMDVRIKLNPIREVLKGKRVVIIEDSIVRGTTSRIRVKNLREAGAKEIYMAVSCPPIMHPCFYGIDFPNPSELVAAGKTVEEIRESLGLDGLRYLSRNGMLDAMEIPQERFCTACFSGDYHIKPSGFKNKEQFE